MSIREIIARWLAPDAFRTVERYHYLRSQLSDAERWLGYEWPEVDAAIMWAKASEVNHFRGLDDPKVETIPGKPWIWSISDFREHLREQRRADPLRVAAERICTPLGPRDLAEARRTLAKALANVKGR